MLKQGRYSMQRLVTAVRPWVRRTRGIVTRRGIDMRRHGRWEGARGGGGRRAHKEGMR